uniref:Uncharacterized protein n=1 Tax=Romanomermis culicivorax TaxID=13658 RepID=A0A915KA97_ROMCU
DAVLAEHLRAQLRACSPSKEQKFEPGFILTESVSCSLSNSCVDFQQLENSLNGQMDYPFLKEPSVQKSAKSKKDSSDLHSTDRLSPLMIDKPQFSTPKTAIPVLRVDKNFCTDVAAKISALNLNETTTGVITSTRNSHKIYVKTTKAVVLRDQAIKKKHFPTDY